MLLYDRTNYVNLQRMPWGLAIGNTGALTDGMIQTSSPKISKICVSLVCFCPV